MFSQQRVNMEVTSLCITQLISVLVLLSAQVQHSYSHKADSTFPRIVPSRLQFFEYESVHINCGGLFNDLIEWRVMRKIKGTITTCNHQWETTGPCNITTAFSADSGEYWCEADGKKSNTVNIIVTAGSVILESPAVPVMEGEAVTLRCRSKKTSNGRAYFFKDDHFINSSSAGNMTIHSVSKSDEGLYKCSISGAGESAESQLAVTGGDVILESPALPVMEQQDVTLRCRMKANESKLSADFFKDGRDIGIGLTGEMTIYNISRSHEGRYKCRISGVGESAESWLTVTEDFTPAFEETTPQEAQQTPRLPPYPGFNLLSIPLMVVFIVLCVAMVLMVSGLFQCWKHRVACFSSKMPTTGSEAGCQEANVVEDQKDVTYALVTIKETKKREENVTDRNETTYAVVALKQKETDNRQQEDQLKDGEETPSL